MPDVTASYGMSFEFIVFFYDHSCLNCCISIKLSLIVYLINTNVSCINMPDVTTSYGMPFNFIQFFANSTQNCRIFLSEVLYLQQTFIDCVCYQYTHFNILTC